jgi:alkylhydroperoxidase/carboxymuconolactone decarboxylase family protein YurZ
MNDSNQTRAQQLIGELKEAIIHLAFYAGWPKAMSAITVAREIFTP